MVGDSGDITFSDGRALRMSYQVSLRGDIVDTIEVTALADGTVLREDAGSLRFVDLETIDAFLRDAGFSIEAQYGDWQREPITAQSTEHRAQSTEIITIARAA